MSAATKTRPRISDEYLRANTCERIMLGTATVIARRGYRRTTVAEIVSASRMARNTFYSCYGSKSAAALAVVSALGLDVEEMGMSPTTEVLAFEVAAFHHVEPSRAVAVIAAARAVILGFANGPIHPLRHPGDPLEASLPPGKHDLSREFIRENHRSRIASSVAHVVAERSLGRTRIADISRRAAISRRTFYEYFRSTDDAAAAMVQQTFDGDDLLVGIPRDSVLFALAVEILAERLTSGDEDESPLAAKALVCLDALAAVERTS